MIRDGEGKKRNLCEKPGGETEGMKKTKKIMKNPRKGLDKAAKERYNISDDT